MSDWWESLETGDKVVFAIVLWFAVYLLIHVLIWIF